MNQTTREPLHIFPRISLPQGFRLPGPQVNGIGLSLSLLFLVIICIPLSLSGAAGATEPITLKEAIRIALRSNHEIRSMESVVLAGKEDVGIAMSYLLPGLFFEERALRTNNPTYAFMAKLNQERFTARDFELERLNNPDAVTDYQTSLSFEQPLFVPKAYIGFGLAKKEAVAKEGDLKRKREEIAFLVVRVYLDIQTATDFVRVADRAAADIREHLRLAELRYQNGLGLYSDVLRASTSVTEAEQKQVTARKNLAVAERALGLLLSIPGEVGAGTDRPEIPLRELSHYTGAASQRKDIQTLEMRRESARDRIRLAETGYLPTVGVGGTYQWNDHDRLFGTDGVRGLANRGGSRVYVEHQVTIGAEKDQSPVLGDRVFLGAGAKIVGPVTIGSDVRVGANAVVVRDVPPGVTVGGVPARILRTHDGEASTDASP